MLKLKNLFKAFSNNEAGAVTVDWVVLTAAVVGLSAVVGSTVLTAINNKGNAISSSIASNN